MKIFLVEKCIKNSYYILFDIFKYNNNMKINKYFRTYFKWILGITFIVIN